MKDTDADRVGVEQMPAGRTLDALVAERVMGNDHWLREREPAALLTPDEHANGYGPCDGFGPGGECSACTGIIAREPPRFSTDATADYMVLKRVRETWGEPMQSQFHWALWDDIWQVRAKGATNVWWVTVVYEPGDYSRAALAAIAAATPHPVQDQLNSLPAS